MTKPRILVTRLLTPAAEARIARDYDAITNPQDISRPIEENIRLAEGCQAIICVGTDNFRAETIAALPDSVKALATQTVGYDHIDLDACKARGIKVGNTPDVLTAATADLTMLCLLGAARVAQESGQALRDGKWTRWATNEFLGVDLEGRRLGILGMGRIGQQVARRAAGFGLKVQYHNRRRLDSELEFGASYQPDFDAFLGNSDILAITCPLTPETKGIINATAIAKLPDGAILVNTARGPILEDEAVLAALHSGKLFAVGLDVFTSEPQINPGYLTAPRAYLLPHVGSATIETRTAMGFKALDNLDAFFAGKPMPAGLV